MNRPTPAANDNELNPTGWIQAAARLAADDDKRDPEERQDWAAFSAQLKDACNHPQPKEPR